jgi:hypothetical protein
MPYSKPFRDGLQDALEKARWRMEVHFRSHFQTEARQATLGDLHKSFVVMHDCLENLATEIVNYLEAELGRGDARTKASRPSARRTAARGAPRRRPGARKKARRPTRKR